jgi:AcrR family transcriptional regulator
MAPDRAAIVSAAAPLLAERGIAAVRMEDVADAAGVGVATLYRRFGTKTALVIEATTLLWSRFRREFSARAARQPQGRGIDRMAALLGLLVDAARGHAGLVRLLDEFDRSMLLERVPAETLAGYEREVAAFAGEFRSAFDAGVADGSIRADVDFGLFYRSTTHALVGIAEKLTRGDILPSDDFARAGAEVGCVADMALAYLRPVPGAPADGGAPEVGDAGDAGESDGADEAGDARGSHETERR